MVHVSAASGGAASAVWLDAHTLQPTAHLALPADTCHAWTDFGLQKALVSSTCGSVFTFPNQPQVQCLSPGQAPVVQSVLTAQVVLIKDSTAHF